MATEPGPEQIAGRQERSNDGVEMTSDGYKFDLYVAGKRFKPTIPNMSHNQATMKAMAQLSRTIKKEIKEGTFRPREHFPTYRNLAELSRLCGEDFQEVPKTFRAAGETWLITNRTKWKASTYDTYKADLEKHWYQLFGDRQLRSISDVDVMKYRNSRDFNSKSWNNWLVPLRGVFKYAMKKRWISVNPLLGFIENEKVQKEDPTPFTVWQAIAIIAGIREWVGEATANYYEFAFATGMRTSELIALTWDKINLQKGTALVNTVRVKGVTRPSTKTDRPRTVKLVPRAQAVLMRQRAISGLAGKQVFLRYNGEMHGDYHLLYKDWRFAMARVRLDDLPVPYLGPYQTRASSVTWRLMLGAETPTRVAQQHGHAPEEMFASYFNYIESEDDAAEVAAIEQFVNDSPKTVPNALRSKYTMRAGEEKAV